MKTTAIVAAALSMLVPLSSGLASTDTITWGGDNTRTGYQTNHNMDPAIVGSEDFAQIFKTALPGNYNGAAEQIFSQPLVYTPSTSTTQYVYFATTQNNVYKLDAKTGEILLSRNLAIPFLTADLDGCVDINPLIGVTSTGVIDPDTDTLYLMSKTYANQTGGNGAQGKPNGRYYLHAIDVNDLTERANFPVNLESIVARNNPVRSFNGGIQHQRPGLLNSGQYIYAGFASHCVQYNFTGWLMGFDKTTGAVVERYATEGEGVPNTTPGGGIWMSGGGLASDDQGSLFFGTGNGFASQLSTIPVEGRDPPTALEEAAVHMTLNDDGSVTIVDFFMPQEKQALDGADKDLGTSPLELLPSEFSCGSITHMGVITGKSGKTYFLNLDDLGGYRTGPDSGDRVIQVYQNENSVYAGAGVYPLEGGYIYINVIQYPTHVFKFSCVNGVPSFTKVADSPEDNAYTLGVSHGTVTSLNGEEGTGLLWTTDVQGNNLRIYNAVPENGYLTEIRNFSVPGTTKFTRAVFGDGRMYMGTTQGYVYGFGAPTTPPLNCSTPVNFGSLDIVDAGVTVQVNCTAVIATTINSLQLTDADFTISSTATFPKTLAAGASFSFTAQFKPTTVGLLTGTVSIATTNGVTGYSSTTSVLLEGTGLSAGALLSISPTELTFTNVVLGANPGGIEEPVIFSNLGNSTLTISDIQFSQTSSTGPWEEGTATSNGTEIGAFTLSGLPSSIAALGGETVEVTFNPTVGGNYTLYVQVLTNGGNQTFHIDANAGPGPTCLLEFQTPDGLSWVKYEKNMNFTFGNVTENTSLTLLLRVTNNGTSDAVPLSLTVSKPPFGVAGIIGAANQIDLAEGTILNPGQSATASLYCAVPKEQWNTDTYYGAANWTMNTNDPNWDKQYIQFSCEAVSEQAPPLQSDGQGVYRYVGCFKENNPGRQLTNELYSSTNNTAAMCIAACAAGGYTYCGTQYNSECWAGNTIPVQEVDDNDCNYPCSGSVNQICGGNGVGADAGGAYISLYAVDGANTNASTGAPSGPVVNPGDYGYVSLGCYHEPSTSRALANQLTVSSQTVDTCLAAAAEGGYQYAGLEYGGECWVGASLSSGATLVNVTTCTMTCNNNQSEYCGGSLLLNVYELNGTAILPSGTSSSGSSTPTSTGGPFINPGADGYQYIGCWNEPSTGRAFANQLTNSPETVDNCLAAAAEGGYTYAGLEYGGECWVGNTINSGASKAASTACTMTCNGNTTELCGGSLLLDVYQFNATAAVSSAKAASTASTSTTLTKSGASTVTTSKTTSTTSTSTTAAHTTKPTVGNWVYQGCYTEGSTGRALAALSETNNEMTYEECAAYCSAYAFFGVEYGDQCYCGNYLTTGSNKTSESDCSTYCAGDSSELCGAGNRLNVYYQTGKQTGPPVAQARVGTFAYLGCYSEGTAARALASASFSSANMTQEACATYCTSGTKTNYTLFGVEYSTQCYCGNALSAGSTLQAASACDMACGGSAYELCGGPSLLNVYTYSPQAEVSSSSSSSSAASSSSVKGTSSTLSSGVTSSSHLVSSSASAPTSGLLGLSPTPKSNSSSAEVSASAASSSVSMSSSSSTSGASPSSSSTSSAKSSSSALSSSSSAASSSSSSLALSSVKASSTSSSAVEKSLSSSVVRSSSTNASTGSSAPAKSSSALSSTKASPSTSSSSSTAASTFSSVSQSASHSPSSLSSSSSSSAAATTSGGIKKVSEPTLSPTPSASSTSSSSVVVSSAKAADSSSVQKKISSTVSPVTSSAPSSLSSSPVKPVLTTSSSTVASPSPGARHQPVVAQGNANFTIVNCFQEPSSGHLLSDLIAQNSTSMTVQMCLGFCDPYVYAGLENGDQCWCSNALNLNGSGIGTPGSAINETQCNVVCPGNTTEYCGAEDKLLVYNLTRID
ncbi:hypothetical protein SEUCBS139899_007989 [Sporothrix eucalyptigena]